MKWNKQDRQFKRGSLTGMHYEGKKKIGNFGTSGRWGELTNDEDLESCSTGEKKKKRGKGKKRLGMESIVRRAI